MRGSTALVLRFLSIVAVTGWVGARATAEPTGYWKYASYDTQPKPEVGEGIAKAMPGRLYVARATGTPDVSAGSAQLESVWETDDVDRRAYTLKSSFGIKVDQSLAVFVPGRKVTLSGSCSVTGNALAAATSAYGTSSFSVDVGENVISMRAGVGKSDSQQGTFVVPGGGPGASMVLNVQSHLSSYGAFSSIVRVYYEWQTGPAPAGATDAAGTGTTTGGATGGASGDYSGTWRHGPTETWTLTPAGPGKYTAVEQGFDNARGTATVTGNTIRIDYTTRDGKRSGHYTATVAPDGKTADSTWEDSTGATGSRQWVKVSGPASDGATGAGTPPGPAAAAGLTVQAGSRRARAGQTVTVPVWLIKGSGVANLNVTVTYDAAVARAEGAVAPGNLIGRRTAFEANPQQAGVVKVGLAGRGDLEGTDGTLAQIPFRVTGKPGDRTTLHVAVTDIGAASGPPPTAATVDGEILVVGADGQVPGDTDGDGTLTAADALNALRMSVDLIPVNLVCDLNKDGKVTSTDAVLIMKKVVGK